MADLKLHTFKFNAEGQVVSFCLGQYTVYECRPKNWRMVKAGDDYDESWHIDTAFAPQPQPRGIISYYAERLPYTVENLATAARASLLSQCDDIISSSVSKIQEAKKQKTRLQGEIDFSVVETEKERHNAQEALKAAETRQRAALIASLSDKDKKLLGVT